MREWLRRQARRRALSPADRALLREMAADAADSLLSRLARGCADCERAPDLICARHMMDVRQMELYERLAAELGAGLDMWVPRGTRQTGR